MMRQHLSIAGGDMLLNQKGEGKAGAIFGFAVFLLLVYLLWQIIPVMVRVFSFEDKVREDCKYLQGRTLDDLKDDILDFAEQEDLPIEKEDIAAAKTHVELHDNLRVRIQYSVPITTPFYVYNWERDFVYDAPSFE
jgi:hypothetical protein